MSDLPLLDAARLRLGDPEASRRKRRHDAAVAAQREQMAEVVDELIVNDDSEMHVMSMLRGDDLREKWVDEGALPSADPDLLAGPFAHIVVDEAQELTDAEWQMLLLRCPSRSLTIVGDRAQARHGFAESWQERLERVGLDQGLAGVPEHQLPHAGGGDGRGRAGHPGRHPEANVPTSVRRGGVPVVHASDRRARRDRGHLAGRARRRDRLRDRRPDLRGGSVARVRSLTPELSKGLEFDLVVLVDPDGFGDGIEGRSTTTSR